MRIIGHRGASLITPENTKESIIKAFDIGADGAECDVTVTLDDQIILLHDDTTKRTCIHDSEYNAEETNYEILKKLDAGSFLSNEFSYVRIPLLSDVLAITPNNKNLFIEVKSGGLNQGVSDKLKKAFNKFINESTHEFDNCFFISFDHTFINELKRTFPKLKVMYLTTYIPYPGQWPDLKTITHLRNLISEAKKNSVDGIDLENSHVIEKEWIQEIKNSGLKSAIWSYRHKDTVENAKKYMSFGVDYLKTDEPDTVKASIKPTIA